MEGRVLTIDELIAAMHDIRLPADAPGGFLAEMFAAIGLGLGFALLLSWLLSQFTKKLETKVAQTVEQRVASVQNLQEDAKVTELLHILRSVDPARAKSLSASIYERSSPLDAAKIEQVIRDVRRTSA